MRVNRSPGPPLVISIVVLVAGFVVALVGGIGAAVAFARSLPGSVSGLPAVVHRHFDPGRYDVYQRTGNTNNSFPFSATDTFPTTLSPADVAVSAPDGTDVPVLPPSQPEAKLSFGSDSYTAVAEFSVNQAGDFVVVIRDKGGQREVLIGRAGSDLLQAPAGWLVVFGSGGLVALVGFVMLLVGIIRRDHVARLSRAGAAVAPVGVPAGPVFVPAGWYPDPGGTAHWRWWDGAKWTEHTG